MRTCDKTTHTDINLPSSLLCTWFEVASPNTRQQNCQQWGL